MSRKSSSGLGHSDGWSWTRRGFIGSMVAATAGVGLPFRGDAGEDAAMTTDSRPNAAGTEEQAVTLTINGASHELSLEPRVTLLDALREHLGLTGTKKGCDRGQCGACTVLVEWPPRQCLPDAGGHARRRRITTVEGLAHAGDLHPSAAARSSSTMPSSAAIARPDRSARQSRCSTNAGRRSERRNVRFATRRPIVRATTKSANA